MGHEKRLDGEKESEEEDERKKKDKESMKKDIERVEREDHMEKEN